LARAQGATEGREEARAKATEVLARAYAERDALLTEAEGEIAAIALRAAEKILGREVSDHGAAVEIVSQALGAVRRARRIKVRICPEDAPALREREGWLVARVSQGASFELCEDPSIARGGCIVETDTGSVDARLETQLAALRRALFGEGG
jgi:flagellar biosynthesis/type III secretory pathway protein FliH